MTLSVNEVILPDKHIIKILFFETRLHSYRGGN